MADPTFESIKVPDRNDATAKKIDNVQVTDASGNPVDRQVVVAGDPVDHSLVGRVVDEPTEENLAGPVVWPPGTHGEAGRQQARSGDQETRELLQQLTNDAHAIRAMLARFFEDYADDDESPD